MYARCTLQHSLVAESSAETEQGEEGVVEGCIQFLIDKEFVHLQGRQQYSGSESSIKAQSNANVILMFVNEPITVLKGGSYPLTKDTWCTTQM